MNINPRQFSKPKEIPFKPKALPSAVKKNYKELSAFITLQIKQARLKSLQNKVEKEKGGRG